MRILLVDDHAILRHGLKDILVREFPGAEFEEAETAQGAIEKVWNRPFDVVLLDVTMPGRSGLDALKDIKRSQPKLPVLILSMHPEELYAMRVLKAGASGFVNKAKAPLELVEAIKMVMAGGKYVSAAVADKLVNHLRAATDKAPHERLSNREFQILLLVASGKSVKEIAQELSLSQQTVSTHRARMLKKMGLHTTGDLIRYALENKLVDGSV
jgi:DNA-binding NarL/FixJ family response regulator